MALPGQRVYQSGVFEAVGLVGQLLVALPNLDVFAGAAASGCASAGWRWRPCTCVC